MDDLSTRRDAMAAFVTAEKARAGAGEAIGILFSNGANILAAISLAPRLFDTLAPMHSLIPWHPEPEPGLAMTRVLITAGQPDPICPPGLTQALGLVSGAKADVTFASHPGGHEVPASGVAAPAAFLS